ncbi:MAG: alpha-ribazole phosphatase [Sulfurospirillaceae bacterium]|nr:alpha-ribazole phosphatase [Sulfurospirillaceae bacterium]
MVEKIYLIRHGHINTGGEKRYLGVTDIPLDDLGIEQAKSLKSYFHPIPIDAVFTSPLQRCLKTSAILCDGKNLVSEVVENFSEINMGDWENRSIATIKSLYPEAYEQRGKDLEHFTPPHGESFKMLSQRVIKAFNAIVLKYSGTIVIVAHAGVNRMLLTQLLGKSINDMFSIEQPYACVGELIFEPTKEQWHYQRVF